MHFDGKYLRETLHQAHDVSRGHLPLGGCIQEMCPAQEQLVKREQFLNALLVENTRNPTSR